MTSAVLVAAQAVEVAGLLVLATSALYETVTGIPVADRVGRELSTLERVGCGILAAVGIAAAGATVSDRSWGIAIVPYLVLTLLVRRWLVYFDREEGLAGRLGLADVSAAGRGSRKERMGAADEVDAGAPGTREAG